MGVKYVCKRCFSMTQLHHVYKQHLTFCRGDTVEPIFKMPPSGSVVKFINQRNQQAAPFVIYADLECILKTTEYNEATAAKPTIKYQRHEACAAAYVLFSKDDSIPSEYGSKIGADAVEWLLERLLVLEDRVFRYIFDDQRMLPLTNDEELHHLGAKECYICGKPFNDFQNDTVRHHEHISGQYRGWTHRDCNLPMRKQYKLPVFFHNGRNYDNHMLTRMLVKHPDKKIRVIGQGLEKYLSMDWSKMINIKDSFQFLSCSLETLGKNLLKDGPQKFVRLRQAFPKVADADLLLGKQVFPYEWLDSMEKLDAAQLPPRVSFDSRLKRMGTLLRK